MYKRLIRLATINMRRLTCALLLLSFLATAVGFPVFHHESKQTSEPFPCQHHACGCVDADHCWRQCCCYSPQEKLAWARKHGVEPPTFAIAAAGESPQRSTRLSQQSNSNSCAVVTGGNSLACCDSHQHEGNDESQRRVGLAIGDLVRHCRGLSPLWSVLGAALPPPPTVTWDFQWDVVGWIQPIDSQAISIETTPPVPPPRECA
jgi:hypothetical protein